MSNQLDHVPRYRHPGNPNRNEDEPPPPQPVVNVWEEQVQGHGNGRQRHGRQRHGRQRHGRQRHGRRIHGHQRQADRVPRLEHPRNQVPPVAQGPENPVPPPALVPRLQLQQARVSRLEHSGNTQPPADDYVDIDRINPQPFREEILPPPLFLGGITVRAEPGTNIRLFTLGSVDEEIDENDDNPRHCMFCLVNKAILSTSCCPTNPSVCKNCMHVLFVGKFVGRQCLNCQRYTVDYVLNSN